MSYCYCLLHRVTIDRQTGVSVVTDGQVTIYLFTIGGGTGRFFGGDWVRCHPIHRLTRGELSIRRCFRWGHLIGLLELTLSPEISETVARLPDDDATLPTSYYPKMHQLSWDSIPRTDSTCVDFDPSRTENTGRASVVAVASH